MKKPNKNTSRNKNTPQNRASNQKADNKTRHRGEHGQHSSPGGDAQRSSDEQQNKKFKSLEIGFGVDPIGAVGNNFDNSSLSIGKSDNKQKGTICYRCRLPIIIFALLLFIGGSYYLYRQATRPATLQPSLSLVPSFSPSITIHPTLKPSDGPSSSPTDVPSLYPSPTPTSLPSVHPTDTPTSTHSTNPTDQPTSTPTLSPTLTPSVSPTDQPTSTPTLSPTLTPSVSPTDQPTSTPTVSPTTTHNPTASPTNSISPSMLPSTIVGYIGGQGTPEGRAHSLMMNQMDIKHFVRFDRSSPFNEKLTLQEKIDQRFAMLTLFISLAPARQPRTTNDECEWPEVSCSKYGVVKELHMARMGLNGVIPSVIGKLTSLTYIDFAENRIVGRIPEELYDLEDLEGLYLHENVISGTLSERIGNLRELEYLYLCRNRFSGRLPENLKSTSKRKRPLKQFSACYNQFSGPLPSKLELRDLQYLDLSFNQFTGRIPDNMFRKCYDMKWLYLDHNRLSGQIPVETVTAGGDDLQTLDLGYNSFTGSFPFTLDWAVDNGKFSTLNIIKNRLSQKISQTVCNMSVFEYGDVVQMEADCNICTCDVFCEWCWGDDDYEYDDDVDDDDDIIPIGLIVGADDDDDDDVFDDDYDFFRML